MYENKKQPLAPKRVYYSRIARNFIKAFFFLLLSLLVGIFGYHYIAGFEWIDAVHNASMILGGMGPVVTVPNVSGKIFSSIYAIFCGVALLTNIGLILAPAAHRLLHKLHLDESQGRGGY